ncbi:MAG: hypothetical protein JWN04_2926 [Myxococcaceae bacterium]|nr:hypothetical protein [Myxococcaceae bacterium]
MGSKLPDHRIATDLAKLAGCKYTAMLTAVRARVTELMAERDLSIGAAYKLIRESEAEQSALINTMNRK